MDETYVVVAVLGGSTGPLSNVQILGPFQSEPEAQDAREYLKSLGDERWGYVVKRVLRVEEHVAG